MDNLSRHDWTEKDEKVLLDCVNWVETTFPKGSETLASLGGKWEVVSIRLKNDGDLNISYEACKSRFFKIKSREQHKTENGQEIVSLLGTDFPQANLKAPDPKSTKLSDQPLIVNLQRRVNTLEKEVTQLKTTANSVMELNDNLTKFFKTFGVKVPQRNV